MSPTHAALEVGAVTGNPFAENIVPRFDDSDVSENDDEADEEEALRSWKVAPQAIAGETRTEFIASKVASIRVLWIQVVFILTLRRDAVRSENALAFGHSECGL
jgi:hypothetical protein